MYLCSLLRTGSSKLETSELCLSGTTKIRCQCTWTIKRFWSHTRNTNNAKQNGKASLFMGDQLAELDLLWHPIGTRKILVPPWRKQRLYFSTAVQNWKRFGVLVVYTISKAFDRSTVQPNTKQSYTYKSDKNNLSSQIKN